MVFIDHKVVLRTAVQFLVSCPS